LAGNLVITHVTRTMEMAEKFADDGPHHDQPLAKPADL